jgi:hypothetical protein
MVGLHSAGICTTTMQQQQQQQQQNEDLPPGQAFLASLVDYEKLGVPKAAGVAAATAAATAAAAAADVVAPARGPGLGSASAAGAASSSSSSSKGFDLRTMQQLLAEMGNPQQRLSVVHIAGTKGKGSVAALISGVLRAAGYRVGTYTSPHMFDIRERIVVGGVGAPQLKPASLIAAAGGGNDSSSSRGRLQQHLAAAAAAAAAAVPSAVPISSEHFESLAVQAAAAVNSMLSHQEPPPPTAAAAAVAADSTPSSSSSSSSSSSTKPSHFEVVTAMAFQHFVNEAVDIAVIETGLGGATDATNVFEFKQLQTAVLTAVGLDHVDALGGSLESIARAKAGIMKAGVPVVVGPQAAAGSNGSNGGSSGAAGVVLRIFCEDAGAADMKCPLLRAEELVQVSE